MTALYGINSINLPHVNIFKWAAKKKIFIPIDFKRTREQEEMFLKLISMRQYFVRLPTAEEQARFSAALKESMKYLPLEGFKDKTVIVFQVAGTIFCAVLFAINATAKL